MERGQGVLPLRDPRACWLVRSRMGGRAVTEGSGPGVEEGPFSAFGQFGPGQLDTRVFAQGTWWVNRDGVAFRIDSEMSERYVRAVLAFLFEHAVVWHMHHLLQRVGNLPDRAHSVTATDLQAVTGSADAWLEGTPLVRALRRRLTQLSGGG